MELHSAEVVHEPPRPHGKCRRLGRGFMMVVAALGLIAIGALGATLAPHYLGGEQTTSVVTAPTLSESAPSASEPPTATALVSPAEVVLSPEAISRAGIKTAAAEVLTSQATIQLPGTVMADAYREVKVVPIVGGIVTKVHVELGGAVKRGAALATLFSPELAEAQTKYLSMRAMLAADHQKLQRTQQLVAIGAASRQELEDITAAHASHATEVEAARQRLLLLGQSRAHVEALTNPGQIVSDVTVPAPCAATSSPYAAECSLGKSW